MKFSLVALAIASTAQALPLFGLFSRATTTEKITLPTFKATNVSNSTSGNATNATNSSSTSSSSSYSIKLISFSDEFSDLYYGEDATDLDLTSSEISKVLSIPLAGNSSISSVEAILNTTNATIDYEQLGDSFNETALLELYQAISDDSVDYDGIIVALAPSSIESSAFFVQILASYDIPVIFTTALGLDNLVPGVVDLYDSVLVATGDLLNATESGVLVVADRSIFSSLYAVRSTSNNKDTITSEEGVLGKIYEDTVQWFYDSFEVPAIGGNFTLESNTTLPEVLVIEYTDDLSSDLLKAITNSGVEGIVFSAASISDYSTDGLKDITDLAEDVSVVFANSDGGSVSPDDLSSNSTIAAGFLSPTKAKVLLQAALGSGLEGEELNEVFIAAYGG